MWLHDLTSGHGFRVALFVAVALSVLIGVLAATTRAGGRQPPVPVAALAAAAAALIGLRADHLTSDRLILGIAVLFLGSVVAAGAPRALAALAAVPGAVIVGTAASDLAPDWAPVFVIVVIVAGAPLVATFDDRTKQIGVGPALLPITALGIYATVPDTEEARVLVGATAPVALLGLPWPLASLGGPLALPLVGVFVWVAATGGRGRPGSIVGGAACVGALLLGPALADLSRRPAALADRLPAIATIGAVHVIVVAIAARVAGRGESAGTAAVIAVLALAAGAGVFVAAGRRLVPARGP